jgi:prevent-host-death family protein
MAVIDTDDLISVSEATKRGISGLIRSVESGREPVIVRNNLPMAVVIGIRKLERLQQLEDDLADLALVTARALTDTGGRPDLDDILRQLGYTRDQHADVEE